MLGRELTMTACLRVSALEPTDVAKALATSLAPVPHPKAKAANEPTTTSHWSARATTAHTPNQLTVHVHLTAWCRV